MSEILIGQSYTLRFDPKLWEAMQPYPPLGALYAASYLRNCGYEVGLFDAMLADSETEWLQALEQHRPRFAILYEDNFNYLSKMCLLRMRQAALVMVEMARRQGCTVIVGGSDASDHPEQYLAGGADFVLAGEGEYTLGELLDHLTGRSPDPLESIQGLVFLDPLTSNLIQTPRRPDIRELDKLPFPAWDLVDIARYQDTWRKQHGYYSMNMVTTRGCPFHCNWCAKPIWGQRYNIRSPENVVAEIKWLNDTYHPDHINFVDDILGLKPGWLPHFADLLEAQQKRLPFKCLSRVDLLLRDGEIEALRRAGCQMVWVGAESGSQRILDAMEKGTRVEQIYAATSRLKAAGIGIGFFLQFGYPGETRADIQRTVQMVRDCLPDDIGMSVSYPLPGTKFYAQVKDQLSGRQNWIDSNDLAMLYRGPFTTAFYRQLHTTLHKEFRARKAWERLRHPFSIDTLNPATLKPKYFWKDVRSLLFNLVSLPLAWLRLQRQARAKHQGLDPLPQGLSPEAASQPTRQPAE